jgi:hypothetical protein
MEQPVPFSEVLELLKAHGWELTRIWSPYRVFTKPRADELPILIEVHDRMVRRTDVERIKKQLEEGGQAV